MAAELGHLALILALGITALQSLLPAWGLAGNHGGAIAAAVPAAVWQFILVFAAFVCLAVAFLQNDFSVVYVASNSQIDLPTIYRLTAVWGGHEGSMLLWMLMLSGWTVAVAVSSGALPTRLRAQVLAVLGVISAGFLLFMLLTSNPFDRQFPVPLDGRDLNPLLQDPGMIIHPPMLYMGYVGFSVAFAFAIAALLTGRLDETWARWMRPWTTAAWAFLTIGITLGSWWAYHELGWGGWWFWDPVENASFMPWLVGTALIHSLAVTEKRGLLKSWTALLAIMAFALSLLGTFLVRSGVLVSVHAFATDPARGVFILVFLGLVVGSALTLYAWRAPRLVSAGEVQFLSREGLLLFNNVFLLTAATAVLLGTLYPLVIDALNLGKLSVGPPYFNAVFVPLTVALPVLAGLVGAVSWKRSRASELRVLAAPAVLALLLGGSLPWVLQGTMTIATLAGSVVGLWTVMTAWVEISRRLVAAKSIPQALGAIPRSQWGMALAHTGLGLFVLGITHVSQFNAERDVRLAVGQSAELAGYEFVLDGVKPYSGANFEADRATVRVLRNGELVATLQPEKRLYRVQRNAMTEAAVDASPLRDLYVALGEPLDKAASEWSLRLYYRPLMRLVWLGGLLAFLGGLVALTDRRYRVQRSTAPIDPAAAAATNTA